MGFIYNIRHIVSAFSKYNITPEQLSFLKTLQRQWSVFVVIFISYIIQVFGGDYGGVFLSEEAYHNRMTDEQTKFWMQLGVGV